MQSESFCRRSSIGSTKMGIAQAQRLMVQADIDNSIARLNVWRAFLKLQYIRGDLQQFLQEANR
jgi:outer membrane protein